MLPDTMNRIFQKSFSSYSSRNHLGFPRDQTLEPWSYSYWFGVFSYFFSSSKDLISRASKTVLFPLLSWKTKRSLEKAYKRSFKDTFEDTFENPRHTRSSGRAI